MSHFIAAWSIGLLDILQIAWKQNMLIICHNCPPASCPCPYKHRPGWGEGSTQDFTSEFLFTWHLKAETTTTIVNLRDARIASASKNVRNSFTLNLLKLSTLYCLWVDAPCVDYWRHHYCTLLHSTFFCQTFDQIPKYFCQIQKLTFYHYKYILLPSKRPFHHSPAYHFTF